MKSGPDVLADLDGGRGGGNLQLMYCETRCETVK